VSANPELFLVEASACFAICGLAAVVYCAAVLLPAEAFVSWAARALTTSHVATPFSTERSVAADAATRRFYEKQRLRWCYREAQGCSPPVGVEHAMVDHAMVDHAMCWAVAEALRSSDPALFAAQLVGDVGLASEKYSAPY
jgi:hypothetical protein